MKTRMFTLGCALCTLLASSGCSAGSEQRASSDTGSGAGDVPTVASADVLAAAGLTVVKASQAGSVTQTIADAEIRVVYSRPVARGRELFGTLVKWGEIWNPGADQATRIEISRDIRLAGHALSAGSYSVWAIPDPEEWTLILSHAWDVYHIPYPGESDDALRFTVRPRSAPHMETLAFYFPSVDRRNGMLALHWGETLLEIPVEVPETGADPDGGAEPGGADPDRGE